jgi:hypothetical protein
MTRVHTSGRALGFVAGCLLAVGFVVSGRMPETQARLGADLALTTGRSAELTVEPSGRVLSARDLAPGQGTRGAVSARNPTGVTLAVTVRVRSPVAPASGLRARVTAGGRTIFGGSLARLVRRGAGAFRIRSRQRAEIALQVSAARLATGLESAPALPLRLDLDTEVAP